MRVLKGLEYKTMSILESQSSGSLKIENKFLNYIQEVLKK